MLKILSSRLSLLLILVSLISVQFSHAGQGPANPTYYSNEFYEKLNQLKSGDVLRLVNSILKGGHLKTPKGNDRIVPNCVTQADCEIHTAVSYTEARQYLFGKLHLQTLTGGGYSVTELYCNRLVTSHQTTIGPGLIPAVEFMNTEHTWPQSRFTSRYSKDLQKSDMHHLFPTDTEMNSHRSSMRFGEVVEETEELKCTDSKLGHTEQGQIVFEPPTQHKGNVARAIFYFAARYEMQINDEEETTLRAWNQADPVDEAEFVRNEEIYKIQKDRNPFIDFPELIEKIENF